MQNQLTKGVDYTGVCVVYFCHDGRGNFLMQKRGKNARDEQGKWDIGAGALEFGTSVEETLKKEMKEEYCADVLSFEFLGFRDVHREIQLDADLRISVDPLRKKTHWIGLDFKVLVDPKKVKNGEPHKFEEVKWFTVENFPESVHSQAPIFFEKYKDELK